MTARSRATWWLPLAVALVTAAAFAATIQNGFTDWDDPAYVVGNALLRDLSPSGIRAIASSFVEGNYHPLTIGSLALDYHFWKLDPAGYHLTNIALHVLATLAVFQLIFLLTGSRETSAITALFFGVHPVHVESVAWVSTRKDVLYGLFYLAACVAYVRWIRAGGWAAYVGALVLFVLSALSKGMAVALPVTLLAIDFYLGRPRNVRTVFVEKAPFFSIALAFGIVAVVAQQSKGAVQEFALFPFHERLLIACHAILAYLFRAIAPLHLSAFYPYPTAAGGMLPTAYYLAPIGVLLILGAAVASLKSGRTIAFGGLFFLINLALVLQLFPVGSAAMADRYTYLPYVGVGLVIASGYHYVRGTLLARAPAGRAVTSFLLACFFIGLVLATRERGKVWKDSLSLWTDVVARYPDLSKAYAHRAWAYHEKGESGRAMSDLEKALSLNRRDSDALSTRGTLYLVAGDYPRALADLDMAVRLRPQSASAWNNRGTVLLALKRTDEAIANFDKAIERNPWYTGAYLNRALAHGVKREFARSLPDLDRAVAYAPENPEAFFWRGAAKVELGDAAGAIRDYDEALRLSPRYAEAYFARSIAHGKLGQYGQALRDALAAREAGYRVDDAMIDRLRTGTGK